MKSIFVLVLLFPVFVFACEESNKPKLHIVKMNQVLDESSVGLVIPKLFNGGMFDTSSVNLGNDKVFIAQIPLKTQEIAKPLGKHEKDFAGSFYAHFSINRMMEKSPSKN